MLHRLQFDQVYLVADSPHRVGAISEQLRSFGAVTYHFDDIDQIWMDLKEEVPDLLILDLGCMYADLETLKHHPSIQEKKCPMIFAVDDESAHHLPLIHPIAHAGVIFGNTALDYQIYKAMQVDELRYAHAQQLKNLKDKSLQLANENRVLKDKDRSIERFIDYHKKLVTLAKSVEKQMMAGELFLGSLSHCLGQWSELECFAGYELSQGAQKLLALDLRHPKYSALPSLWLGQPNDQGVSETAQTMALQVAHECLSKQVFTLKIKANYNNPDIILFLALKEGYAYFQWGLLEQLLSSFYRAEKLVHRTPSVKDSHGESLWSALSFLDEVKVNGVASGVKFLDINLTSVIRMAQTHRDNPYSWEEFFEDFYSKLQMAVKTQGQIIEMSPYRLLVIAPTAKSKSIFEALEVVIVSFQYWRYFADSSLVISQEVRPTIQAIAPGAIHYLDSMEKDLDGMATALSRVGKKASLVFTQKG